MKEIYVEVDGEMVNVNDIEPEDIYKNLDTRDMTNEQWAQFREGKNKTYHCSTLGRIKAVSKYTGKENIKMQDINKSDYLTVNFDGRNYLVHRIIAKTWIPNPQNKPTVNHINSIRGKIKSDNRVVNLAWATHKEQANHAHQTGLSTSIPVIALSTNGDVLSEHYSFSEASRIYGSWSNNSNQEIKTIGNVLVMSKDYYESLTDDEVFSICTAHFENMISNLYLVNSVLVDGSAKVAQQVGCVQSNVVQRTNDKSSATINGHSVSRLKNMIGVGG